MVTIRICPRCKEPSLKSALNVSGWLGANLMECKKCGYIGYFFIEIDPEDFKLDEEEPKDDYRES
ncbi:MAG: hypothetical protein ACFFBC_00685 [Promethearchaeota archaeon]